MTSQNMKDPEVPEIWYKWQRALRSILGALIILIPMANGLAAAAIDYLESQTDVAIPPVVFVWLNVIVAVTALIIGLFSRLMAVPGFNDILTKIGFGSVPKSALQADASAGTVVKQDPNATRAHTGD